MGQKVNPIGLRLGINRTWDSRWFARGDAYSKLLKESLDVFESNNFPLDSFEKFTWNLFNDNFWMNKLKN